MVLTAFPKNEAERTCPLTFDVSEGACHSKIPPRSSASRSKSGNTISCGSLAASVGNMGVGQVPIFEKLIDATGLCKFYLSRVQKVSCSQPTLNMKPVCCNSLFILLSARIKI